MPVPERGGDRVVTVGEYVRADIHRFTDRALDREAAIVHAWTDALDDHAAGEAIALRVRIRWARPLSTDRRLGSGG